jgi:hypothetical protein
MIGQSFQPFQITASLGAGQMRDLSCSHLNAQLAKVPLCKRSSGSFSRTPLANARMSNTTDLYPRKNGLKSFWT